MAQSKDQYMASFNSTLSDATDYPSIELCETAKKGFAEWYLLRGPFNLRLATVRCWLEANHPEHQDDENLLWEIWDGFCEYIPDSDQPNDC